MELWKEPYIRLYHILCLSLLKFYNYKDIIKIFHNLQFCILKPPMDLSHIEI